MGYPSHQPRDVMANPRVNPNIYVRIFHDILRLVGGVPSSHGFEMKECDRKHGFRDRIIYYWTH